MLNNREIASVIWMAILTIVALSNKDVRESAIEVFTLFFSPRILLPIVSMLAWICIEIWIGFCFQFWSSELAKGTILWTLCTAGVILFNFTQFDSESNWLHFFRRTILAMVGVAAIIEFFVEMYVMSLPLELGMQTVIFVPSIVIAIGDQKQGNKSVMVFCKCILAFVSYALIINAARHVLLLWAQMDARELFLEFMLPIWLTAGLVPFLCLFGIYSAYEDVFRRMNWDDIDAKSRFRFRMVLFSKLHLRVGSVKKFVGFLYYRKKLGEAKNFCAAGNVVDEFIEELRRREQAKCEKEQQLVLYSGSQQVDGEGCRLDRREFEETKQALLWLATCQSGWYRTCGNYRDDILSMLEDKFIRYGLPREHGIRLHVTNDGNSWYAWRRTVSGWCFAIGAAIPPPDQWQYDGPVPPKGFPGRHPSWGESPFDSEVIRNWM